MIGPTNEQFVVQESAQDEVAATAEANKKKMRSSGLITKKKGFLIFGVSLIGVLALAGVAIGVSTSPGAEDTVVPAAAAAVRGNDAMLHLVHPVHRAAHKIHHHKTEEHKNTHDEKPAVKKNLKLQQKETVDPKTKETVTVCETPECTIAANALTESMDVTVDPCVDFYEFACGGWYDKHPVTDESLGTFYAADDLIQERLQLILESDAAPTDPQPLHDIRTFYDACIDTDTMDSVGIAPLWTQLSVHGGWPLVMDTWDSSAFMFEHALSHTLKIDAAPFVFVGIDSDFLNTTNKIFYFSEGELGLSSTYLLDPTTYATEIGYYKTYISDSAKLVRDSIASTVADASIDAEVDELVNFEISLTNIMNLIPFNKTDVLAKTTIAGIQAIADSETPGQIDWLMFFRAMFNETDVLINSDEPLYIFEENYLPKLSTLFSTTPVRVISNYLGWSWTQAMGSETTYAMRNVSFAFQQNLFGRESPEIRSEFCRDQVNYNLGFPMSRAYVDEFFPTTAKAEVTELVELMRTAFQSLLDENTWMAPNDLVVAKEKLDAITDFVAYPDWIMDNAELTLMYQGMVINNGEQFNNILRVDDYYNYWKLETYRDAFSKQFIMPPTVVNAFYDVFSNSITILAGILQYPFYQHNSLAALNYGGIGMVIGHEFTHGFDNTGRRFDKDGNYANWWSQGTIDEFNARAQCFVDQYNTYSPPELVGTEYSNMTVNGQQTLGENIADNGGIREAFRAYTSYVALYGEEPRLPGLLEYTPSQLFFLGNAVVWCEHRTTDDLVRQLESDPHSPGRFRILGPLSNDADFSMAFNCPVGTPMNKGNASCVLW